VTIVTLLTDFGSVDTYVGQLKGAILAVDPSVALVDLTHSVPPQNVRAGAFLLWTAVEAFPPGSIHLAVVDPGVGTSRRAIAAKCARGDFFAGPDNGLLPVAINRLGGLTDAVELTRSKYWNPRVSQTFHGRDVFAPVAGHLARGVPLRELGEGIANLQGPQSFPLAREEGDALLGEILHIDSFGTLITNLWGDRLANEFTLTIRGRRIAGRQNAVFESVAGGTLLAFVGSAGLVEVALRNGSAASELQISVGVPVSAQPTGGTRRPNY
jgi:S-adenosylmethionine hydrolase